MEASEVTARINLGEDNKTQFKETINHPNQLEQELVAFSNSEGGTIFIGIDKHGAVKGLSFEQIEKINQHISNTSSQHVKPSVAPYTQNIDINGKTIIAVSIAKGIAKPYYTREGIAYVKMGSDKRIAPPEEILRLFQESSAMYADEMPVANTSIADLNLPDYEKFVAKRYERSIEQLGIDLPQLLENQRLLKSGTLTLAALLLFCENRHFIRPQFSVQCLAVAGTDLLGNSFEDNEPPFEGTLENVYYQTLNFIGRNMKKIPSGESFNSPLQWEIPRAVFEEVVVNALIHRDYYINTTIKLFIFADRVEVISPGKLPNSQNEQTIAHGVSIPRNPILQSFAQYILPYRGLGTGLMRSVALWPTIRFENNVSNQQFKVILPRKGFGII